MRMLTAYKKCIIITFFTGFIISIIIQTISWTKLFLGSRKQFYEISDLKPINVQANVVLNTSIADSIQKNVRIFCWVETYPGSHKDKVVHIWNTWGKRCDKTVFISTKEDKIDGIHFIKVNVTEGYHKLLQKSVAGLKYIHDKYLNEYDWFYKADDDTYMIVENLRHLLEPHSPNNLLAFGGILGDIYLSGGAGYVISRASLHALNQINFCNLQSSDSPEDTGISSCLTTAGVKLMDTRDNYGRIRFHSERPELHLTTKEHKNWWFHYQYPFKYMQGFDCCSESAVSFHYVTPLKMYLYDILLYKVWPYGIDYNSTL